MPRRQFRPHLFHYQLTVHFAMSQAAEVRAFKWKSFGLIGRKFNCNGLALRQFLVNVESFELESMISVECCNDQLDVITSVCFDYVWQKLVLFGGHFDLADHC